MTSLENVDQKTPFKTCNIQVQFNGKISGDLNVVYHDTWLQHDYIDYIQECYRDQLKDKVIVKTIYVPHKLINFVVKDKDNKNLFVDEGTPYEDLESLLPIENIELQDKVSTSTRFLESANWLDEANKSLKERAKWFVRKKKWWYRIPLHLWSTLDVKQWNVRVRVQNIGFKISQSVKKVTTMVSNFKLWKK